MVFACVVNQYMCRWIDDVHEWLQIHSQYVKNLWENVANSFTAHILSFVDDFIPQLGLYVSCPCSKIHLDSINLQHMEPNL